MALRYEGKKIIIRGNMSRNSPAACGGGAWGSRCLAADPGEGCGGAGRHFVEETEARGGPAPQQAVLAGSVAWVGCSLKQFCPEGALPGRRPTLEQGTIMAWPQLSPLCSRRGGRGVGNEGVNFSLDRGHGEVGERSCVNFVFVSHHLALFLIGNKLI